LIPLLIEAIKELSAEIEQLKSKLGTWNVFNWIVFTINKS
jgi:hypothetical protein